MYVEPINTFVSNTEYKYVRTAALFPRRGTSGAGKLLV